MATTPFAFFTVPGDIPRATKPVADHILKLEAEVAHLRGLLTPSLNTIDARTAMLRAQEAEAERDLLRAQLTKAVQERGEARTQLTTLRQSAARAVTLSKTIAEGLDALTKPRS